MISSIYFFLLFSKEQKKRYACMQTNSKMQPQSMAITSVWLILCHDKYICMSTTAAAMAATPVYTFVQAIFYKAIFLCKIDRFSVISRSWKTVAYIYQSIYTLKFMRTYFIILVMISFFKDFILWLAKRIH